MVYKNLLQVIPKLKTGYISAWCAECPQKVVVNGIIIV